MLLYLLDAIDMWGREFAHARLAEPHPWLHPDEVCPACYQPRNRERSGPYTVMWQPGCDVIPDFFFAGNPCDFTVTQGVKLAFETVGLEGYRAWAVKVKAPPRRKSRRRPMVPWPYKGPALWDIYVPTFVHIIPEASDVIYEGPCGVCGRQRYFRPLDEGSHCVIDRSSWDGSDFMRPHELRATLVTQRVVDLIEREGFTNVKWTRWGEIGDRETADLTRMRTDITPTEEPEPELDPTEGMPASFPVLSDELTAKHRELLKKLVEYVKREENDEDITAEDLTFLRSAQVEDCRYWIWKYEDDCWGSCYATVSQDAKGRLCLGCDSSRGFTPEQFMWAYHHGWL